MSSLYRKAEILKNKAFPTVSEDLSNKIMSPNRPIAII